MDKARDIKDSVQDFASQAVDKGKEMLQSNEEGRDLKDDIKDKAEDMRDAA